MPKKIYIMLNKPRGIVTTMSDEKNRPTVSSLVTNAGARVLPVGRLDINSEGLLLMTNDNELINRLTHPSHKVEKEYHVKVGGFEWPDSLGKMSAPAEIDGKLTRPAKVRLIRQLEDIATLSVVIYEGRKHQVRILCANAGLSVGKLTRVRVGNIKLGGLNTGEWRALTEAEKLTLDI
jgi:23S rRNA pseudouridine2605 synthase